jgi:hypothetical protein
LKDKDEEEAIEKFASAIASAWTGETTIHE